uniref:hypothetical protein n=1 Tax=Paenarthrobacter ureafaciens TaxID=37931 RepID=UPI003F49B37E
MGVAPFFAEMVGEWADQVTGQLPSPPVVFCCWHVVLYGADGGVSSRQGKVLEIFVRK